MAELNQSRTMQKGFVMSGVWVKTLLVFFFLFEFNLSAWGLPTIMTSRRVVVLIVLLCVVFSGRGRLVFSKTKDLAVLGYKGIMRFQLFVLIYSGFLLFFIGRGSGEHIFYILLRFFYMAGIGLFSFRRFFTSKEEFLRCILIATLVQVGFILLFIIAPQFQTVCDQFTGETIKTASLNRRGYRTGFACSTSMGVLKMSPALASCIYFYLKDKIKGNIYLVYILLITVGATIIARTGLLMGLIALLIILIGSGKAKSGGLFKTISGILIVIIIALFTVYALNLDDLFSGAFDRLFRLRDVGVYNDFFAGYFGQIEGSKTIVPPLTMKTIIGTGITSGISSNGIAVNVDGGFARMYVAVGLPLAILFYIIVFKNTLFPTKRIKKPEFKYTMIFLFLYLFLGEFKEFFIDNGFALCIIFALLMLDENYGAENEI
jgi:hypothetical protein